MADVLDRETPGPFLVEPEPEPAPTTPTQTATSQTASTSHSAAFTGVLREAKHAINLRRFQDAHELLQKAIVINPRSAEAHNLMGVLYESRGDREASYQAYQAALRVDRRYEPAQQNMQRYYERSTFGRTNLALNPGGD